MTIPFEITRMENITGRDVTYEQTTIEDFNELIKVTVEQDKPRLPLFTPAEFGSKPSPPDPKTGKGGGSLRWKGNLLAYTGWVVEHDLGTMPASEMADRLNALGIAFGIYTTPSSAPQAPRWRAYGPFSRRVSAAEYPHFVNILNGISGGGVLADESWSIAVAWRYGAVVGASIEIITGAGEICLDEEPDFARLALPRRKNTSGGKSKIEFTDLTEDELEDLIRTGTYFYRPARELATRYALDNVTKEDAEENLRQLFDGVDPKYQDRKWSGVKGRLGNIVAVTYEKVAKQRGTYFRTLVTHLVEDPLWAWLDQAQSIYRSDRASTPVPAAAWAGVR
jgi:hypothetical protein